MTQTVIELAKQKAREAVFATKNELQAARQAVAVAEGRLRLAEDTLFGIERIERDYSEPKQGAKGA